MRFWDASGVVPLCIGEPWSPMAQSLLNLDTDMVVWWGTRTECIGAFARRTRVGDLDPSGQAEARACLAARSREWLEVPATEGLRLRAERLLSVHPLRTADSFQLAAALEWCE